MFAPLDNEDSATSLVLRRHASRQRQHFSRCRACSEQMMPRVVAMTPTPDSRVRVAPVESPKTEPSASCVSTSPTRRRGAYGAELATGAKKTLDRYKPGRDYLAP